MDNHNKTEKNNTVSSEIKRIRKSVFYKIVGLILVIIVGIGVKVYMDEKKFNDEMMKVVRENKSLVEEEIKKDDSFRKIETIDIDYSTVKHNPMGGIMFEGFVNGNEKLSFSAGFRKYIRAEDEEYSDLESTGVDFSKELDDYLTSGDSDE
ncbi:DUF1310 family protein [Enterococcus sp. LJL51]|uniref:DUF1310 family protein n=1 Tax=Enterococcus sp. LJL51 TaxID=3416656 RepID=UPI003CEE6511